MDGVGVDLRQPRMQRVDVGVGQSLGGELRAPRADVGGPHGVEPKVTERLSYPEDVDLGLAHRRRAPLLR